MSDNRFGSQGQFRLNPLLLARSKWYIDGVAVTATAAQLNAAGSDFWNVKYIAGSTYVVDPVNDMGTLLVTTDPICNITTADDTLFPVGFFFGIKQGTNDDIDYVTFTPDSSVDYFPSSTLTKNQAAVFVQIGNNWSIVDSGNGGAVTGVIQPLMVDTTLNGANNNCYLLVEGMAPITITLPANVDQDLPKGYTCKIYNNSDFPASIASPGTIVGLNKIPAGQEVSIRKITYGIPNVWLVIGDTSISGEFTWQPVSGTSQAMVQNNGYIPLNSSLTTFTLPAIAAIGDKFRIGGFGAGGWIIAQNAGQTIHLLPSNTTTGVDGSLASQGTRDSLEIICVTANTDFLVVSLTGNPTII